MIVSDVQKIQKYENTEAQKYKVRQIKQIEHSAEVIDAAKDCCHWGKF